MVHKLKTINPHFQQVWDGNKKFEIRLNDRNYQVGDILHLQEYDDVKKIYLSRYCSVKVTSIITDGFGLKTGYCVMSIQFN